MGLSAVHLPPGLILMGHCSAVTEDTESDIQAQPELLPRWMTLSQVTLYLCPSVSPSAQQNTGNNYLGGLLRNLIQVKHQYSASEAIILAISYVGQHWFQKEKGINGDQNSQSSCSTVLRLR